MLKLGVVGTGWISKSFINAAHATNKFTLTQVNSSKLEHAINFVKNFSGVQIFTDYLGFLNSQNLDVVYIALPNNLHYQYALDALNAGKHIIIEKPAFISIEEHQNIYKLAFKKNLLVFEAARNIHEKNFKILKNKIDQIKDNIIGANFIYAQYSSRYQAFLDGKKPNVFSLEHAGGALMDLGVYLIYTAVDLFGIPNKYYYFANILSSKVDSSGIIIFEYNNFKVEMFVSKISDDHRSNIIYLTNNQKIKLNAIQHIKSILMPNNKGEIIELLNSYQEDNLVEEADIFADIILNFKQDDKQKEYLALVDLSRKVNLILTSLRDQI